MRYAVLRDNIVVNVIELDSNDTFNVDEGQTLLESDKAVVGDTWDGVSFIPRPTPVPPVPGSITDRQFFQAVAQLGRITQDEALAIMSSGVIPESLTNTLSTLSPDEQFAVKMKIIGAHTFERSDPFVINLATASGLTPVQLDELFRLGSTF